MAGNNQKYDVKKISQEVVMYQIDRLDVFIGLLTGSSALCKVFSSRFKAGELSFIFIFTWVKQADFEKVICLRYILSCASTMQAPCKHTFKDHESVTEAQCKHIAIWQCEHLWSTIKSTACVHLCVRSSRRKTRGPVAEGDHARERAPLAWIK